MLSLFFFEILGVASLSATLEVVVLVFFWALDLTTLEVTFFFSATFDAFFDCFFTGEVTGDGDLWEELSLSECSIMLDRVAIFLGERFWTDLLVV